MMGDNRNPNPAPQEPNDLEIFQAAREWREDVIEHPELIETTGISRIEELRRNLNKSGLAECSPGSLRNPGIKMVTLVLIGQTVFELVIADRRYAITPAFNVDHPTPQQIADLRTFQEMPDLLRSVTIGPRAKAAMQKILDDANAKEAMPNIEAIQEEVKKRPWYRWLF